MISPSDRAYVLTKKLKKKSKPLSSPFREMADWIASTYNVQVLNIIYSIVAPQDRPRLEVILERRSELKKFQPAGIISCDCEKKNRIREHFKWLLAETDTPKLRIDGLFVVFSAFEEVARIEANWKVTDNDLAYLRRRLNNSDLWRIRPEWDYVVFFFFTRAQAEAAKTSDLINSYAKEYAQLVSRYDEFGYMAKDGVLVCCDSKENFDTDYQGNWFYYDKR